MMKVELKTKNLLGVKKSGNFNKPKLPGNSCYLAASGRCLPLLTLNMFFLLSRVTELTLSIN